MGYKLKRISRVLEFQTEREERKRAYLKSWRLVVQRSGICCSGKIRRMNKEGDEMGWNLRGKKPWMGMRSRSNICDAVEGEL